MIKKAFCGGKYCTKYDRKYKCEDCKKYTCSVCSVSVNRLTYCINCYVSMIERQFDSEFFKVKKEFNDMVNDLFDSSKIDKANEDYKKAINKEKVII